MTTRYTEVYLFLVEDALGNERPHAAAFDNYRLTATADDRRRERLKSARRLAEHVNARVRVVKFTTREDVEAVVPARWN